MNIEQRNYYLGVICGDGSLDSPGVIIWASKDRDWIEQGRKDFGENELIHRTREDSEWWTLRIHDPEFIKLAVSLGLVRRKSFKPVALMCPEDGQFWHFLRGLMDSDGSCYHRLQFFGTEAQMNWVYKSLIKKEIWCRKNKHSDSLTKVEVFHRDDLRIVYSNMYQGASRFLLRKKEAFEEESLKEGRSSFLKKVVNWPSFRNKVWKDLNLPNGRNAFIQKWGLDESQFYSITRILRDYYSDASEVAARSLVLCRRDLTGEEISYLRGFFLRSLLNEEPRKSSSDLKWIESIRDYFGIKTSISHTERRAGVDHSLSLTDKVVLERVRSFRSKKENHIKMFLRGVFDSYGGIGKWETNRQICYRVGMTVWSSEVQAGLEKMFHSIDLPLKSNKKRLQAYSKCVYLKFLSFFEETQREYTRCYR